MKFLSPQRSRSELSLADQFHRTHHLHRVLIVVGFSDVDVVDILVLYLMLSMSLIVFRSFWYGIDN